MKCLEIDNVRIIHEDAFKILIDDKEEIKAERYEDGWMFWDNGDCLLFDTFGEVSDHVQDLANHYDLFPPKWYSKNKGHFVAMMRMTVVYCDMKE